MTTQLATSSAPVVVERGDNIQVSAATPNEMAQSQSALISWVQKKISLMKDEAKELRDAYTIARDRKWKSATLLRHADLADKRVTFYEKLKGALDAGYIIVPNFPVSLFLVRTDKNKPRANSHYGVWRNSDAHFEVKASGLPAGEGEHKNPDPIVCQDDQPTDDAKTRKLFWADRFDEVDFPITMAKPNIMEATTRAMALKIFDDFGILPAAHRYQDPMIVARILDPRSTSYNRRYISFIIAWHLDTSVL